MKYRVRQWIKMLLQAVVLPFVYFLYRRRPIDPHLVLFADAHHDGVPESMRGLLEMTEKSPILHVVRVFHNYQAQSQMKTLLHSVSFMRLYAQAGHVVICDNFLPVSSCRKRKETKVLQLWHGCGAFKKFGYDTPQDIPEYYRGHVFQNYDTVAVSGETCVGPFTSAMGQPVGVVQPLGVPRTDLFFDQAYKKSCREDFFREYPQFRGKKIVLWTPTFRGTALEPTVAGLSAMEGLENQLGEDWLVVAKLHPHMKEAPPDKLFTAPSFSSEQMLLCSDLLITDYSSIIFEYSLLEKPMVFFVPDLDEYKKSRGFYLDFEALPGRIVRRDEELVTAVLAEYSAPLRPQVGIFRQKYMSGCDGGVTRKMTGLLEKGLI